MRTLTEEQKPNWPVYLPSLSMLIILLHMHQQVFSHMNLCSGAKHQHLAMIGWDWHIINQTVSSLRLSG